MCHAGCLPRKELYEAWEMARRVRRVFRGGRIVDLAAGHGLLAHVLLILDNSSPQALSVDTTLPPSSLKLHEVAPKITELRLPVNLSFYIMNKGQFDKLSAPDREAMLKLGQEGEKRSAPLLQKMSDDGAAAMKAQKADTVRLNDAQLAEFRKAIGPAFAKMDADTGEDGKRIAAIVKKYW